MKRSYEGSPAPHPDGREPFEQQVLRRLAYGAAHVDELSRSLDLPPGRILGVLATLEVRGMVRQEPGMVFATAAEPLAAEAVSASPRGA